LGAWEGKKRPPKRPRKDIRGYATTGRPTKAGVFEERNRSQKRRKGKNIAARGKDRGTPKKPQQRCVRGSGILVVGEKKNLEQKAKRKKMDHGRGLGSKKAFIVKTWRVDKGLGGLEIPTRNHDEQRKKEPNRRKERGFDAGGKKPTPPLPGRGKEGSDAIPKATKWGGKKENMEQERGEKGLEKALQVPC